MATVSWECGEARAVWSLARAGGSHGFQGSEKSETEVPTLSSVPAVAEYLGMI